ncbi:MAG TPA: hypothetical protein VFI31_04220 [Pirellulales bacterium]|nr:hypothetical protein [Pirellulales bacterium]
MVAITLAVLHRLVDKTYMVSRIKRSPADARRLTPDAYQLMLARRTIFFAAAFLLADAAFALAGLPHWHRRRQVPYPSDTYAPQMRHYNVIDPVVVGTPPQRKHSLLKNEPAAGQVLWRQHVEPVPNYPWGWFGARRHVDNAEHIRYYGDAHDWSYLRGD